MKKPGKPLENEGFSIILNEDYPCDNKDQLTRRERECKGREGKGMDEKRREEKRRDDNRSETNMIYRR